MLRPRQYSWIRIFLVAISFVAAFLWLVPAHGIQEVLWARAATSVLAIGTVVFLVWEKLRNPGVPDVLRGKYGKVFESMGVRFCVDVTEQDNTTCLRVRYQNRYSGSGHACIELRSLKELFRKEQSIAYVVAFDFVPAEAAELSYPIEVPAELSGRSMRFSTAASVAHLNGVGTPVLRGAEGLAVPECQDSSAEQLTIATLLVFPSVGDALLATANYLTLVFPKAAGAKQGDRTVRKRVLWPLKKEVGNEPVP